MLQRHFTHGAPRRVLRKAWCRSSLTFDGTRRRSTLSNLWIPSGGRSASKDEGNDGHGKLVRAGFIRQVRVLLSQSGIFQLLPLGQRVQDKLEGVINKHMQSIGKLLVAMPHSFTDQQSGASRLSLSTLTTAELWQKSGRLETSASEVRQAFILQVTLTDTISAVPSERPPRCCFDVVPHPRRRDHDAGRKLPQVVQRPSAYRDEKRPRHGLLRSREFLMKDLYSFDMSVEAATDTYRAVSTAYAAIFADLKLPILVAEASSGDMGGDHSHEYHLAHSIGEDTVAQCSSCGYTANDEVAVARSPDESQLMSSVSPEQVKVWRGVANDHQTLVNVWFPSAETQPTGDGPSLHAVRAILPGLDTSIADPLKLWTKVLASPEAEAGNIAVINIVDARIARSFETLRHQLPVLPDGYKAEVAQVIVTEDANGKSLDLLPLKDGDRCPKCDQGTLKIHKALELGHTFHLGTRYSSPLKAQVTMPSSPGKPVPVQMGCYGIGISRIMGAVAEHLVDERGLNWPRAIAPYEVAVIPSSGATEDVLEFYDTLTAKSGNREAIDAVLDDRKESFGWKMRDADTIGYPVLVVLGKEWKQQGVCEVQCRRRDVKEKVALEAAPVFVQRLLDQL
ncbi:tRNA synthetase class II core domain (G, h, p, S and t) domain-containing protein [Sarocladium implicatum]|nr:tRNA synthetase class II core domain (G, h, p, S and t) domain-containing protein [Sarocladium implicatum]